MIDQIIVAVYFVMVFVLGTYKFSQNKSLKEFALSSGNYGGAVIFATLSASYIGGGFSTGNASKVFLYGIANIVALWGFSFKEMLAAKFIIPKLGKFKGAFSVGDIMSHSYGKSGQMLSGLFGFVLCAGVMAAQVGAMGIVMEVFLGFDRMTGVLIGCGLAVVYSTLGGMRGVIMTDIMQFCLLVVGIPLTLVFGVIKAGGVSAVINNVPADHWRLFNDAMPPMAVISLFFVLMFGETLVPPYIQRMLIGRDLKVTARATFWSGVFSLVFFAVSGSLGLVALAISPEIPSDQAMAHVIMTVMPVGLMGLTIAGMISIVLSSADSFLNSASICFVRDLVEPMLGRRLEGGSAVTLARCVNAFTGVLAIVGALAIRNVQDLLVFTYTFWTPVILVPLAATILGIKAGKAAFFSSAAAGMAGYFLWVYAWSSPFRIDGVLAGLVASLVVFSLVAKFVPGKTQA